MPHKKVKRRLTDQKYLGKVEDLLESLRDLEEDLVEALEDLGHQPRSARPVPPEAEARPASANPWGWATPDELRRRQGEEPNRPESRNPQEAQRPAPANANQQRHEDSVDTPCEYPPRHDHDDSSSSSDRYECSDSSSSDYTGSDQSDSSCMPCHVPCSSQVIVNGTLEIPEVKPDAEAILRFKPVCRVTDWQCVHTAEGRKIVVTGLVEIGVEYVANLPDQPMHFVHFVVPFHTFFLCQRPIQGIRCEVEFKHSELLNPRTISKVILLHVRGIKDK